MAEPIFSASSEIDAEAYAEAFDDARLDERARLRAIMMSPEARDRHNSAWHLAFNTDTSADEAVAYLRTLPADAVPRLN